MRLQITGTELPGTRCGPYDRIHVGVQRGGDVVEIFSADEPEVRWVLEAEARENEGGDIDFRGPYVHGRKGERFLYLSWGTVDGDGGFSMFRRAKLLLGDIDPRLLDLAVHGGGSLCANLRLMGRDGTPLCGSVRPPAIEWRAE